MPDDRLFSGRRYYVPREIHHVTRLELLIQHPIACRIREIDEIDGAGRDHHALPSVHARATVMRSGIGHDVLGDAATQVGDSSVVTALRNTQETVSFAVSIVKRG
jgi:hypothetical protein